jgi:organic radical activating enzyme
MAILALNNEIELIVTWVCNWHCEYCCVDTHNRPTLTMDDVKKKLDKVPAGYNVTLSGGEVGSMKRADVEHILDSLKSKDCTIHINTNGLFIKRYRDLCDKFDTILYHCSENIDVEDDIIIDPTLNIEYLLIVTDNNFNRLEDFLNKYSAIQFNLVAASNPDGIFGPTLSNENKHKMLTKFHTRMTKQSIQRVFVEKDFDIITYI